MGSDDVSADDWVPRLAGQLRAALRDDPPAVHTHDGEQAHLLAELESAHEELTVADEELRQRHQQLDGLLRSHRNRRWQHERLLAMLPVPVLTTDANGVIGTVNAAAAALLKARVDRLVRRSVEAFIEPLDRDAVGAALRRSVAEESVFRQVATIKPFEGPPHQTELVVTAGRDQVARVEVMWLLMKPRAPSAVGARGDRRGELVEALSELTLIPVHTADRGQTLSRIAHTCQAALGPECSVSVTLGDPAAPEDSRSTARLAEDVDRAQAAVAEGPCRTAWLTGEPVWSPDISGDDRWPQLGRRLAELPVRTALAAPVQLGNDVVAALNVYNLHPAGHEDLEEAVDLLASATGAVLHELEVRSELDALTGNLRVAVSARAVVDQAKGIVMARYRCSAQDAFTRLAQVSMQSNLPLRVVAERLVAAATAHGIPSDAGAAEG